MAQLGGVHLACEQASNVLSKVLEWGRLMAYLEQSTRYIAYNQRLQNGHYRYYRPPEILDSLYGARFVGDMDRVFDTYGALCPACSPGWPRGFHSKQGDSDFVYRQATRAKSLDALRGLLPAASLSNIGSTVRDSPTSSSSCACAPIRSPRPDTTQISCSSSCARSSLPSSSALT